MGKRKQDPRRDDSSSSSSSFDVKRRRPRHYQSGETSRPNDGTPREGFADVLRDAVIELKDAIQDKESTEAKFNRKIEKLKQKRKKDKEDIRILKEHVGILMEGQEDLKSKIQEMQKRGYAEVDHDKASPSQRSQLSQSTRFRLVIENSVKRTIYKRGTVETEDDGGHIKVVMYDGGNPIAPDHLLASVKIDLVVIKGWFNEPKRDSWSKEEFDDSIIKPRDGITRLVKNSTFSLIRGSCDLEGASIMDNSQQKEVKLGVRVLGGEIVLERTLEGERVLKRERVLEGVSNPFKVQEGKTQSSKKKGKKPSPLVPTRNLVQLTSTHAPHQGDGPVSPVSQHGFPPPVIQDALQKAVRGNHTNFPANDTTEDYPRLSYPPPIVPLMVEGNGRALNSSQQTSTQMWGQSTGVNPMQHGQGYSMPPPNDFRAAVNPYLPAPGQDQYTNFPNGSSDLEHQNHSAYVSSNDIQSTFIPGDVRYLYAQTQLPETYETFRCGRVLLQWDKPHVELQKRWNFLDQLMPLYSTKSRFYRDSFPSTSLMDKAHKLLGSISSGDSVWKMITGVTSQATQTPQRRGVLIRLIKPYDSNDESPVKKQRNAKYQLRFVNRACNDYYTREQIKSEDGTFLRVALYDENNLVVTSGPLSSASVEVLLLHGDFNAEGQDYWTPEEFSAFSLNTDENIVPGEVLPVFGGDCVLALTDGEADLGNINFLIPSSLARTGKFKMGVHIKYVTEESVQEGVTSPFVVRVRLGEELCHHRITPLDELHRVRIEQPNQVCGALVRESWGSISASSTLHDHSALTKARKREIVAKEDDKDDYDSDAHTTKSLKRKERTFNVVEDSEITDLRSQLSQSTRFRLVIESSVSRIIYKNLTIRTEDGRDHIKVVMYDGCNPIAPDHPLASAKVDLVVIEGGFSELKRDSWSKEEFGKSIIKPREGMIRLVQNGTFHLIGGSCDHRGAIITENSQRKEVKLGVMIAVHTEERVLEGVSNSFKVQELKTNSNGHLRTDQWLNG